MNTSDQNLTHTLQVATSAPIVEYITGKVFSHPSFDHLNSYARDVNISFKYSDDETSFQIITVLNVPSGYDSETNIEIELAGTPGFSFGVNIFGSPVSKELDNLAERTFAILKLMHKGRLVISAMN